MAPRFLSGVALVLAWQLVAAGSTAAQPLGTFTWQTQPYCNRLVLVVSQVGAVFRLDGYDDQCGARRGAAAGVASINDDGSVSIGITVIPSPDVIPVHLDVRLNPATLSGAWNDSLGDSGPFAFNGVAAGSPRPSQLQQAYSASGYFGTARFGGGYFFGLSHNGTTSVPTATEVGDSLARFGGGGHTGGSFNWPTGLIRINATEDWTATANGTQIQFMTTENGTTSTMRTMILDHTGYLGIGMQVPVDRLHVNGDIRVQSGCVKNAIGNAIAGACLSDVRFKRDVAAAPAVLDRVGRLRAVNFFWRTESFPERAFGSDRTYGLIADEVEAVLPEIVSTDAEGYKRVDYSALPLLAIQAIGELKAENERLEREYALLANRLAVIEGQLRQVLTPPQ